MPEPTAADTLRAAAAFLGTHDGAHALRLIPDLDTILRHWFEDVASDVDANLGHIETSNEQYAYDLARLLLAEDAREVGRG